MTKKMTDLPDDYLDEFVQQYMETALWSSSDESDEQGGDPLDQNYGIEDLSDETKTKMQKDCEAFVTKNSSLLADWPADIAGHCFWLNRNGHGSGFWDHDEGPKETQKPLSDASHRAGEANLYIGDDGQIYQG